MRVRTLTVANVILAGALIAALSYLAGQNSSVLAQRPQPGRSDAQSLRTAVVNLSEIFDKARDIRQLQELMRKHEEWAKKAQEKAIEDLKLIEADIREVEEGTAEWDRLMGEYNRKAAEVEALPAVLRYGQRLDFAKFSRAIFEKILYCVDLVGRGNYDLVIKAYEATAEELDVLEKEAMRDMRNVLSFHQARTLLFRSDRVPDITDKVREQLDREAEVGPESRNVTAEIRDAIEAIDEELAVLNRDD